MSDALERLKKRSRPTVPARDASLTSAKPPAQKPATQAAKRSKKVSSSTGKPGTPETQVSSNLDMQVSRNLDIQIPDDTDTSNSETLKTKQSTLRLEQGMCDRLQDLCRQQNLSREVVIEAMFEFCEGNPKAMQTILVSAQRKSGQRLQVANRKRAQSMMKRFGQQ